MATKAKWLVLTLGAAGALALVLGTGFAALTTARAASDTGAPIGESSPLAHYGRSAWPGPGGLPFGNCKETLAEALGISQEALQDAYDQAWEAALADAVDQGTLTQDQADEMRDRGQPAPRGGRGFFGASADFDTYLAEALGISVDTLRDAQTEALTTLVTQAVEDESITQAEADRILAQHAVRPYLDEAMASAYAEAVGQAVADGAITQAQAVLLLSQTGGPLAPGGFGRGPFR
jgi:hypothetical protein